MVLLGVHYIWDLVTVCHGMRPTAYPSKYSTNCRFIDVSRWTLDNLITCLSAYRLLGEIFCDKIPDMLRDFEVRNIRNQLLDPENQGKEIKSALNTSLLDCVKEDSKVYSSCISDYIQESGDYIWLLSSISRLPVDLLISYSSMSKRSTLERSTPCNMQVRKTLQKGFMYIFRTQRVNFM